MKMVFEVGEIADILRRHVERTFRLPKNSVTGEVNLKYSSAFNLEHAQIDLPTEDGIPTGLDSSE